MFFDKKLNFTIKTLQKRKKLKLIKIIFYIIKLEI